ncbi:TPA: hypothetical protein GDO54_018494 [Pyxicephalus adspersus]|uniref:Cytochrome P450 n=1 Tax=Pyxicephalus adspersus TaxID=30357 RepID=A0AAV2ZDM2_PYXAD|nr:TPA: hypothetical protein GDO54_018494 [Pyxicephalus adspersus]
MYIPWISIVLLALILSCVIQSWWNVLCRRRKLPPGPTPLPIVGNVLQIRRGKLVKSLTETRCKGLHQ